MTTVVASVGLGSTLGAGGIASRVVLASAIANGFAWLRVVANFMLLFFYERYFSGWPLVPRLTKRRGDKRFI